MSSEIKANKLSPATGTAFTFGDSGDTFTVPSGATITNSGTATGFGGDNTPSFLTYNTTYSTLVNDTYTLPTYNTEAWDTDSAYATGVFTVPAGEGGKYLFWGGGYFALQANASSRLVWYKNGAVQDQFRAYGETNNNQDLPNSGMALFDLSATDTMSLYVYQDGSSSQNLYYAFFGGMKLVGV
tara:strand:- start:60 stop:611 length:552 start_codon:yes stop_codon:yes gene_type:complete